MRRFTVMGGSGAGVLLYRGPRASASPRGWSVFADTEGVHRESVPGLA